LAGDHLFVECLGPGPLPSLPIKSGPAVQGGAENIETYFAYT